MELHSMLRSFRDVRKGADVGRYQRSGANLAPVALPAAADQTRADRARPGKRSWSIPSASVAFPAKQANEWHRWYAWHPVICDNAPGGVVWGLTILRRRERGGWVYRMGLRNRRL